MRRNGILYGPLLASLLLAPLTTTSQSAQAGKDSLRQLREDIATHMGRIHYADSIGDPRDAVRWRIMLAGFIHPAKRQKLYEEAVVIADSADLLDEELTARRGLMDALSAAGKMRRAYDEAQKVIELIAQWEQHEAARYAEIQKWHTDSILAARDSIERNGQQVLSEARHRESGMEATAERWLFIALGLGAGWALTVVLLLVGLGRQRKRNRAEIGALRAEIAAMKEAPKNRMREPLAPPVAEPPPITPVPVELVAVETATMDEALLALFRKRAPERLATLRDARARGDHEKAARVIHTLKPQLVALDESGLGALCLRITGNDAQQDQQRWNADLDLLERSIERLLA